MQALEAERGIVKRLPFRTDYYGRELPSSSPTRFVSTTAMTKMAGHQTMVSRIEGHFFTFRPNFACPAQMKVYKDNEMATKISSFSRNMGEPRSFDHLKLVCEDRGPVQQSDLSGYQCTRHTRQPGSEVTKALWHGSLQMPLLLMSVPAPRFRDVQGM